MKPQRSFSFDPSVDEQPREPHEKEYAAAFRRLYYHLYTNSNASRAERIIADLSNLLLCKIASERNGNREPIDRFLKGEGSANNLLIPLLVKSFPHLTEQDDKFSLEDDALRHGLNELAQLPLLSSSGHVLGEAFQSLMGPRLRGDKGQFFTPRNLVRAIIQINNPPVDAKVVDPACGTAGFLAESAIFWGEEVQRTKSRPLIGIDKDRDLCRLAEAALEMSAPSNFSVINANSLDAESLRKLPPSLSPFEADFVFTNPPFGANIKVTDKAILWQFELGHRWVETKSGWHKESGLRSAQDPQILFLELCVKLLAVGGQLSIVLPEGVFGNSGLGYVWDYVRANGEIVALLDCPRTTFQPSTDTKTNVLIFKKGNPSRTPSNAVLMAVALHCGHDRRGRAVRLNGEPYPDDFQVIGKSFNSPKSRSSVWQKVRLSEPYYLVPRYYDTAPLQELREAAKNLQATLVTIGQLVERKHVVVRKGHEVGAEAYGTGDIPFVRTSDISNYEVSIDQSRGISEEVYLEYASQQRLAPNDILMVADGRYRIGRTAILHEHNYRCIVQSHIKIISVCTDSPVSAIELLYLLNLPMVQHQIRDLVFIQSTLGSLGKRLYAINLPIPQPSSEWKATISRFQDLIEGRARLLNELKSFEPNGYEL